MSRPQSLVATSTYVFGAFTGCCWCRDFSPLSRQQLELHQLHLSKPVMASRRVSCRDLHPLSRHQILSRHHSFSSCSSLSCLSCDPCRDLHQIPSIFLMSRPHNWTVHTQNCINESSSCFHFCSAIRLHFCSTYCCIFLLLFLLSFTLPANNKLVSFFIFLQINCPFLDENQAEKWTKNR